MIYISPVLHRKLETDWANCVGFESEFDVIRGPLANISPVRTVCAVSVTYVTDLCVKAGMKQWPLSVDYLLVDIWVHFDCWYAISSTTMKPSFILVEMSFKINYVMSFGLPTKRDNILPDCCMKRFTDICV